MLKENYHWETNTGLFWLTTWCEENKGNGDKINYIWTQIKESLLSVSLLYFTEEKEK